jgi:hypothetical protein
MEMKIFENSLPPYEDLPVQILGLLFSSNIIPHTTLDNEQCLKLLRGVLGVTVGMVPRYLAPTHSQGWPLSGFAPFILFFPCLNWQ